MKRKKNALWYWGVGLMIFWVIVMILLYWGQPTKEEKYAYVVKIETPYFKGHGGVSAVQGEDVYFYTTAHMMTGMNIGDEVTITTHDGTVGKGELYYVSENTDVAFVKANKNDVGLVTVTKVVTARIDKLKEGDSLWSIYYVEGELFDTEGVIVSPWIYAEDFGSDMMVMTMKVTPGMSGCPIVDGQNAFYGMLCGESGDGEVAVLPYAVLSAEWENANADK